jgi:hypothetical protein
VSASDSKTLKLRGRASAMLHHRRSLCPHSSIDFFLRDDPESYPLALGPRESDIPQLTTIPYGQGNIQFLHELLASRVHSRQNQV